jgi:curli production assembly/transport component CsgF
MKYIAFLFILGFSTSCFSQQLVYTPRNPNFGGSSFNYAWLLSSADAQNSFTDPNATDPFAQESDLERFTEDINRQLLNSISNNITASLFDEDGNLQEGTFTFGSLEVEVFDSAEGLVINILDVNTGETTQVIVPN